MDAVRDESLTTDKDSAEAAVAPKRSDEREHGSSAALPQQTDRAICTKRTAYTFQKLQSSQKSIHSPSGRLEERNVG